MKMQFNREIKIGKQKVSDMDRTFIIAEAGVNHNGDTGMAIKMIDAAADAGADAVKFQMFFSDHLALKNTGKAPYQKVTTDKEQTQYDLLKSLELPKEFYKKLQNHCEERGILFLCTPFENLSLDILVDMGVPAVKVAATDATNIQYLKRLAGYNLPIIFSAGMCYLEEIRTALEAIYPINKDVILLQCSANYPLNDDEVNLNVIDTLKKEFDILVGFSDHSKGVGASPFAVAKGAKMIEKHFTLSRELEGPDHMASVEPDELVRLVQDIRQVETYLGSGIKKPTFSEQYTRKALQKCFVAAKNIKKGELFTSDNIIAKRTNGEGISAIYYDSLLGRIAQNNYMVDDLIIEV